MNQQMFVLWKPNVYYFLFYAAAASLSPFLVLYYESLGLDGHQIGVLTAIPSIVMIFSAPLWTGYADAHHQHRLFFMLATLGAIVSVFAIKALHGFGLLIPAVIVYAVFFSTIMPFMDGAVMSMLGDQKSQYGKIRLWGAVGWGLAAPLMGAFIERSGIQWLFWVYAIVMFVALLVGMQMPLSLGRAGEPFWRGIRKFVSPRILHFLALTFVGGLCLSALSNFLFLYMETLGAPKTLMGFALTAATLSELPMFFFADRLLRRWGARGLLTFSMSAYLVRSLLYSFVMVAWPILFIQLLHGATFSAMWVAAVSYASEIAPPGLDATAQGLVSTIMFGIGSATGALLGGALYQDFGGAWMFRIMAAIAFLSLIIFLVAEKRMDAYEV
jgi:MFS transporter, PPP family, 3-phenylpropionic acid transporter